MQGLGWDGTVKRTKGRRGPHSIRTTTPTGTWARVTALPCPALTSTTFLLNGRPIEAPL